MSPFPPRREGVIDLLELKKVSGDLPWTLGWCMPDSDICNPERCKIT